VVLILRRKTMAHLKLSEEMRSLLGESAEGLQIGQMMDRVGEKGFGLLLVLLSLPSALPIPAAGYSVPFGILLAILALQMLAGRAQPAMPARFASMRIARPMAEKMLSSAAWFFARIEILIRPRMRWVRNRPGRMLMGVIVLAMAVLMMIPIPMTNTAPAFVIFLVGIGLTEEDGLFALAACVVGLLAIALYTALVVAVILYGPEIAVQVKDWIKGLLQ